MKNVFARFIKEEQGQDLIEYVLLAAFIAVASIGLVTPMSQAINTMFTYITGKVTAPA